jgi:Flp pilus assembly pilin Flp
VGDPNAPTPAHPQTRFSADGFWWDGAEWRPAVSQDKLWRWNGQSWEPARPVGPAGREGAGAAIGITLAIFFGVIVLVSLVTVVILYSMGGQISNVFSNVAAALSSP